MAKKTVPRPRGLKCPRCGAIDFISWGRAWKCKDCNRKWSKVYIRRRVRKKDILKMRKLAKRMRLKDVAKVLGWAHTTVERYAKGIRPPYNSGTLTRPNHPCPSCNSIRVVSDGKLDWLCRGCGKRFRKS